MKEWGQLIHKTKGEGVADLSVGARPDSLTDVLAGAAADVTPGISDLAVTAAASAARRVCRADGSAFRPLQGILEG